MTPIRMLRLHPSNPNAGDVGAICESIEANGFYGALYAQRSTGYVVAGNHRLLAADALGVAEVPVIWLDVDDEQAARILVVDNRSTRLGMFDDDSLKTLLTDLAVTERGLAGTGFDGDDLDDLIRRLSDDDPAEHQGDDDRFDGPVARNRFDVVVRCADPDEQTEVLQRLIGLGLSCRAA